MIGIMVGREVRSAFVTSLPWILLTGGQIILAWIFLQVIERFSGLEAAGRTVTLTQELTLNVFGFAAILIMFAAPLLAMRLLSSEFQDGRFDLISAAPVRMVTVVLGKFIGLLILITPLCLLPLVNVLLLAYSAELDYEQLAAATLGLWLAAALFAAVGLYASSLTAQPGTAVFIALSMLLLLSIIGRAEQFTATTLSLFEWLTWNEHLFWCLIGTIRLSDLAYFGFFILFFLLLTQRRLTNRYLQ
ncbi:ABC transporter permease [Chromatium okenii]|uniref:ABC transporter permease subunit n=1 Tax=Chromatium okenii TaxID=61644 RepID=UPI001908EB63|nr:ABC transporter permease subunit [Chromatium okenii]MBK1641308.1 ABC transporter permease [Chromatium okenii]